MQTILRASLALAVALLGCSSDDHEATDPQRVLLRHRLDDGVTETATFSRIALEDPAYVAAHPEARAELFVRTSTVRSDGKPGPARALTEAQLRAFLRDQWDPAVGSAEDEGLDALAFVTHLRELHLSAGRYLRALHHSGASVADFAEFARRLVPLNQVTEHGRMGVHLFLNLLEEGGVKLADLEDALADRGVPLTTLVAEIAAQERGVHHYHAIWKASGLPLRDVLAGSPPLLGSQVDPNSVIGLTNPSWTMFRDNSGGARDIAEGTRSGVVNTQDLTRTNYVGGGDFVGGRFDTFVDYDGAGDITTTTHYHAKGNVKGTYNATHAGLGGIYISDAYMSWDEFDNDGGLTMATASMNSAINLGTADAPSPRVVFTMTFQYEDETIPHSAALNVSWTLTQLITAASGGLPTDITTENPCDDNPICSD